MQADPAKVQRGRWVVAALRPMGQKMLTLLKWIAIIWIAKLALLALVLPQN